MEKERLLRIESLTPGPAHLSVILPAIPRLEKRHVASGLQLNSPNIIVVLGWPCHEAKRRVEALDLKRLHLDATKLYLAKLCESLPVNAAGSLRVQLGSRPQIVNTRFEKLAALIEQEQRHKLSASTAADCRNKWRSEKKLTTIGQATNVLGVVVVVLNGDKVWLAHTCARWPNAKAHRR